MEEQIFEDNLALIERRWPGQARRLQAADVAALQAYLVEGKDGSVSVNGIQLSSRYDRAAEARFQADSLPQSHEITLYGAGLGDLPRALLSRNELGLLRVKVMASAVFALVLRVSEQMDWLQDPRVELSFAEDDADIFWPFFASPAEMVLADDGSSKIMHRLQTEISESYVSKTFRKDDPQIVARLQSNESLLDEDADVASLFGSRAGATAVVVGAGPTLNDNLPRLQAMLHGQVELPTIIACDTATKALLASGIKPDVVVSIDRNISDVHLDVEALSGSRLVYFPMLANEMLRSWQGPRFTAYSLSPIFAAMREKWPRGILASGGSVIHPAVDLASKLGCRDLILLGADFGFPGDKTHAGWSDGELGPESRSATSWTINGYGDRIKSNPNFNGYLSELERYIASEPGVQFWNSSREGAHIAGTDYHPEFVQ